MMIHVDAAGRPDTIGKTRPIGIKALPMSPGRNLLDGGKITVVCRKCRISRKTGCKIFNRYEELGIDALNDQSRHPLRDANQFPFQVERRILTIQQARFDEFIDIYNNDRPHQALNMKYPGELYTPSGQVFAGQNVGIREVAEKIGLVGFMEYYLGFFDQDENRVEPAQNPFIPRLLPMSPV